MSGEGNKCRTDSLALRDWSCRSPSANKTGYSRALASPWRYGVIAAAMSVGA